MASATAVLNEFLRSHLLAFCETSHEDLGVDKEALLASVEKYISDQTGTFPKKPVTKKPATKKPIEEADRCQSRIWGDKNDGTERCSRQSVENGLCTQHRKLEVECCIPCSRDEDGKRKGLWMGRITQFQEGEPGIPPYKNADDIVCIKWKSPIKEHIDKQVAEGHCWLTRQKKISATKTEIAEPKTEVEEPKAEVAEPKTQVEATTLETAIEQPPTIEGYTTKVYQGYTFYVDMEDGIGIYNLGVEKTDAEYGVWLGDWEDDHPILQPAYASRFVLLD